MTDAENEKLARLLIRSATLDVPSAPSRERAQALGLQALVTAGRRPKRRFAVACLAPAAAAALGLYLRAARPSSQPEAAAERILAVAPGRSLPPLAAVREPCPALVVASGNAPLVEDWEADDSWLLAADGRKGSWITYDDGTGTQSPPSRSALFPSRIPGGRGTSKRALHITGSHFSSWGVTFGTELADAACYDASAYAGIRFWAKGPGEVRVGLQMIDVQDAKYGGLCKADCYDTHRKVVALGSSFREYSVRWEELEQLFVAGPLVRFDPARVRFLEFGIAAASTPFDLWLDDVAFIPREVPPSR